MYKSHIPVCIFACLAVVNSIAYSDADVDQLFSELSNIIDSYTGTYPIVKQISKENVGRWRLGFVSRLCGILNSAPATNSNLFNVGGESLLKLNMEGVINAVGFKNPPSKDEVAHCISETLASKKAVSLYEPPITEEMNVTPLEAEVFELLGIDVSRSGGGSASGKPKPVNADFTRAQLEKHLTKIEVRQYDNAVVVGAKDVLLKLNNKVRTALAVESGAKSAILHTPFTTKAPINQNLAISSPAQPASAIAPSSSAPESELESTLPNTEQSIKPPAAASDTPLIPGPEQISTEQIDTQASASPKKRQARASRKRATNEPKSESLEGGATV